MKDVALRETRSISIAGRVRAFYALLRAMNLQPGDEVSHTGLYVCRWCPARFSVCAHEPVYVDIDPRTYNIDPLELERRVTSRSKVIVAQHTFGIPCDMDPIMATAKRHGLAVIEDTCHVWGSKYRGRDLGSIGVAAFLFLRIREKPFIIGMGGAATVNSEGLRARMRDLAKCFRKAEGCGDREAAPSICRTSPEPKHPRFFWGARDVLSVAVEERGGDRDLDQRRA